MFKNYILIIAIPLFVFSGCKDERSDLGDKYFEKGEYSKAVKSYNEYLELYPAHIKSIYNRGRAYEELGQYDKAMADYKEVLKRDPQNINAILSVANDYYTRKKDYENTVFQAEKALDLNEKNAYAYVLKGRAHQKLGNIQEAMSDYNNAISINKDYAEAYISRGSLRLATGHKSRACGDFKTAAALGSETAVNLEKKYCK